jgi:hypothetical protein
MKATLVGHHEGSERTVLEQLEVARSPELAILLAYV